MNTQDRSSYRRPRCVTRALASPLSGPLARLMLPILLLISLCLLAASSSAAQAEPAVEGDLCAEMLGLLEAAPADPEAGTGFADRCSRPLDLRLLMSASAIREAAGGSARICAPADSEITLSRIAEIFFGYGSQYRKSVYEDPYALLVEALEQEYPCSSDPTLTAANR